MRRRKRKAEDEQKVDDNEHTWKHHDVAKGKRGQTIDAWHKTHYDNPSSNTATSAPYGNFASYYRIRKDIWQPHHAEARFEAESYEARVRVIAKWLNHHAMVDGVKRRPIERMLDVGCNSGEVTLELAQYLTDEPPFIVGVDIDDKLIVRAKGNAHRAGYKLYSEHEENDVASASQPTLGSARAARRAFRQPRQRIQIDQLAAQKTFTAAFLQCDWVYADVTCPAVKKQDDKGYDLIVALSVTKWIHLTHYDDGLRRFFARIASSLKDDGGALVLEPQPHKSYQGLHKVTAPDSQQRRNRIAMRVMPDDIPWILTVELGLLGPYVIRDRGEDGFMRALHVYVQPATSALPICCSARRAALLARPPVDDPLLPKHLDRIPWVPRDRSACV